MKYWRKQYGLIKAKKSNLEYLYKNNRDAMMGCVLVTRETRYVHITYLYMQKTNSWNCTFMLLHVAIYFCSDEIG